MRSLCYSPDCVKNRRPRRFFATARNIEEGGLKLTKTNKEFLASMHSMG